jgi:hypothetical protein
MENIIYPLAHDETGIPVDVPAAAVGWLVRRHAGGRGRPAAVYDADGCPLVVALDATLEELRAHGCRPGSYRLDAVDGGRRPLGVAAYTEVSGEAEEVTRVVGPANATDAAIAALARAVEAMQRVQAERERVQAEMFMRLIERLAPVPVVQPASDLRNAVAQAVELKRTLDELGEAARDEEDDEGGKSTLEVLASVVGPVLDALKVVKAAKAPSVTATRNVGPDAAAGGGGGEAAERGPARAELAAKLDAVLKRLSREELDRVQELMETAPPEVRELAERKLVTLTPEQAVVELRAMLEALGRSSPKAAA